MGKGGREEGAEAETQSIGTHRCIPVFSRELLPEKACRAALRSARPLAANFGTRRSPTRTHAHIRRVRSQETRTALVPCSFSFPVQPSCTHSTVTLPRMFSVFTEPCPSRHSPPRFFDNFPVFAAFGVLFRT